MVQSWHGTTSSSGIQTFDPVFSLVQRFVDCFEFFQMDVFSFDGIQQVSLEDPRFDARIPA
jgi:hypothetical protein